MGAYANDYLEKTGLPVTGKGRSLERRWGDRKIANNKAGFIWDICSKFGKSFRTYGEFMEEASQPFRSEDHFCRSFTEWDLSVTIHPFFISGSMILIPCLQIGKVPQLSTIWFITDHTEGSSRGMLTLLLMWLIMTCVGLFVDICPIPDLE